MATLPPNKLSDLTYAAGDVLVWVGEQNKGVPTTGFEDPTGIVGTTFRCLGWVDTSGYIFKNDASQKDIPAAGTLTSIRTIITGGNKTIQANLLEALNPYARAMFDDVPIFPLASSPLKPASGTVAKWKIPNPPLDNRYSMIFDSVDGSKKMRLFAPNVKVTDRGNEQVQQADIDSLQLTWTLYPGTIDTDTSAVAMRFVDYAYANITNYFA